MEVHIFTKYSEGIELVIPFVAHRTCAPGGPGGICFDCAPGFERAFEWIARMLHLDFEWGNIVPIRPDALAVVGNLCAVLSSPTNFLTLVNITNPAVPVEYAAYSTTLFAVSQVTPRAVAARPNVVYIQNAQNDGDPLTAESRIGVYDVSVPTAATQSGTLDLGIPTSDGANGGCDLILGPSPYLFSLLGGDTTVNAARLRTIDVSNPAAPTVAATMTIGTFADRPVRLLYTEGRVYVLSGTSGLANQKVFIYNVANPLVPALVDTLLIDAPEAQPGLTHFFIRSGVIYMIAGDGVTSETNLVIYSTAGAFLGAENVTTGPGGLVVCGKSA